MKKISTILLALICINIHVHAQTTAMDFNKTNCNGSNSHLFADLDSGNAVVLFYYMPNCGSCPPPAKKVQQMLGNLDKKYPGKVKAYAIPYNNTTTCSNIQSWIKNNGLSLFTPVDSGASQVAYYGGMGMPSVVLVGGKDHRVLYAANQDRAFATKDTTEIRDSIINLFGGIAAAIPLKLSAISNLHIFPNPAKNLLNIQLELKETGTLIIDIIDITGKKVQSINAEKVNSGIVTKQFNTENLANGNYLLSIHFNEAITTHKLTIAK